MTSSIKNKGRVNLPFSNNDCDQEWVIPSFPLRDGLIDYNLNNPIDIHAGQIIQQINLRVSTTHESKYHFYHKFEVASTIEDKRQKNSIVVEEQEEEEKQVSQQRMKKDSIKNLYSIPKVKK